MLARALKYDRKSSDLLGQVCTKKFHCVMLQIALSTYVDTRVFLSVFFC